MSLHKLLLKDAELYKMSCDLIKKLSGVDPERERNNFGKCLDFVVSNFLYHRHVDPDETNVFNFYKGLEEKLRIHALRDKAKDLNTLLSEFCGSSFFDEESRGHVEQKELCLRLLYFLSLMSEDPLHSEWSGRAIIDSGAQPPNPETVDYRALLLEGETLYRAESPPDLSEWSDSESDIDLMESESKSKDLPSGAIEQPMLKCTDQINVIDAEDWLKNHLLFHRRNSTTIDELELMSELIWHLREPLMAESSLFQFEDRDVRLKDGICTPQISHEALANMLRGFSQNVMELRQLHLFCNNFFSRSSKFLQSNCHNKPLTPMTIEAYANSLRGVFGDYSQVLVNLEAQLSSCSLLQLNEQLRDWFTRWHQISELHKRTGVSAINTSKPENQWRQVCVLLAVMGEELSTHCSDIKLINIIFRLFCDTCKPYLQLMGNWMIKGQLDDFRHEFVFFKKFKKDDVSDGSEEFDWFDDIQMHPFEVMLVHKGLAMPSIFSKQVLRKAHLAAKSRQLLNTCSGKGDNSLLKSDNSMLNSGELVLEELSKDFKASLCTEIEKFKSCDLAIHHDDDRRSEGDKQTTTSSSSTPFRMSDEAFVGSQSLDPFLRLSLLSALDLDGPQDNGQLTTKDSDEDWPEVDPLIPLEHLIERAILPFVEAVYRRNSEQLLDHIQSRLDLKRHLSLVRKVFLMEAGDVMFEFTTTLFNAINHHDHFKKGASGPDQKPSNDASELLLTLHQCLGRRFSLDECQRFTIDSDLRLSYTIEWPLSIVLDAKRLDMYNEIFNFMLQVKWALWSLEQIQPRDLLMQANQSSKEANNEFMHRVLLLKAWLFHFMTSVHAYFMTRVLHSTERELISSLETCVDLDEVITVHQAYLSNVHDRCFLHKSASALKECVLSVADICHALRDPWNKELQQLEVRYARSHHLLSSTLDGMIRRRSVPHLQGLAAALRHSSPKLIREIQRS